MRNSGHEGCDRSDRDHNAIHDREVAPTEVQDRKARDSCTAPPRISIPADGVHECRSRRRSQTFDATAATPSPACRPSPTSPTSGLSPAAGLQPGSASGPPSSALGSLLLDEAPSPAQAPSLATAAATALLRVPSPPLKGEAHEGPAPAEASQSKRRQKQKFRPLSEGDAAADEGGGGTEGVVANGGARGGARGGPAAPVWGQSGPGAVASLANIQQQQQPPPPPPQQQQQPPPQPQPQPPPHSILQFALDDGGWRVAAAPPPPPLSTILQQQQQQQSPQEPAAKRSGARAPAAAAAPERGAESRGGPTAEPRRRPMPMPIGDFWRGAQPAERTTEAPPPGFRWVQAVGGGSCCHSSS